MRGPRPLRQQRRTRFGRGLSAVAVVL